MFTDRLIRRAGRRIAARGCDAQEQQRQLRAFCGKMAGIGGVAANLILFAAKLSVGLLASSVAIVADALNNLSDSGSSLVALFGVRMASAPPDKEHPFGHGRMEYLSTMMVAIMIMLAGYELAKSAIIKIIEPQSAAFGWVTALVLVLSMIVKLWLALFYRKIGKAISSQTLQAAFADSRNDILCTAAVLVSGMVEYFTGWMLDGYIGLLVAAFVLYSGFSIIKSTITPLLGQKPDPDLVEQIRQTVLSSEHILGIHDLIVHDYGPGRCIVSLHAEVSSSGDVLLIHDRIDQIERELMDKFQIAACIHMDPIDTEDERIPALKQMVADLLREMDEQLHLHDFRVVFGDTHTNLIFDLEVPFGYANAGKLPSEIQKRVHQQDPSLMTVVTVEHQMI